LAIVNTFFHKKEEHLITFRSGKIPFCDGLYTCEKGGDGQNQELQGHSR